MWPSALDLVGATRSRSKPTPCLRSPGCGRIDIKHTSGWGHKEICGYFFHMCLFDQYDATNSACGEAMFRRLQTIEFSYQEKVRDFEAKRVSGGRLTSEEHAIFGGLTRQDSALMTSPALLDHARTEAERSASLAKNLRKAREEREVGKKK